MFNSKKRGHKPEMQKMGEMGDGQLTDIQRQALDKQQEQARALRRLEAEFDLLGRRT